MGLQLENANPSKPAQEVLLSRKKEVQIHPTMILNNIQVDTHALSLIKNSV